MTDDDSAARRKHRQEDLDFSNTWLHGPNFEGTKITDADFAGAEMSGHIEGLILNGVEVAPLVEAELTRRHPERAKLRPEDPDGFRQGWELVEGLWSATDRRARDFPEALLHVQVDGEWSYVETLRHLILATDLWLRRMVLGMEWPCHAWGLAGGWLTDPESWRLDPTARPSLAEVSEVRSAHVGEVRDVIAGLSAAELERMCVPPSTPGHPVAPHTVKRCLHVILNEEYEHNRYAERDLSVLESAPSTAL